METGEHATKPILVVDDDFFKARLISVLLEEQLGASDVRHARDGDSLLHMLQDVEPVAMLLNMNLSRPSAIELLRILDAGEDGVPGFNIIAMVEQGQGDLTAAAQSFGASSLVEMPFSPPEFCSAVVEVMEQAG